MSSGFALSLITTLMWGVLPVFLKRVLSNLDPVTITWVRLLFASVTVGSYYAWSGKWPAASRFSRGNIGLLAGVAAAMAANYWLFLAGLDLVAPPVAQLTIQSGPLFLAIGGWYFFAERIGKRQWTGFSVMLGGFWLFYSGKLANPQVVAASVSEGLGIFLVILAALAWAAYALLQKRLASQFPASFILLAGYSGAGILLGPGSSPGHAVGLDSKQAWYLLFCCVNTVVAYGCFAEAVRRWESPRVSAVLALTPLVTFVASIAEAWVISGHIPQELMVSPVQWLGASFVVAGSMVAALNTRRPLNKSQV